MNDEPFGNGQFTPTVAAGTPAAAREALPPEEPLEVLFDEFRNGAWQLILDPKSPTQAIDRRTDGGIDPEFLNAVAVFIRSAGRALDQPHRELREVREPQRVEALLESFSPGSSSDHPRRRSLSPHLHCP